jgi:hypothetical protein
MLRQEEDRYVEPTTTYGEIAREQAMVLEHGNRAGVQWLDLEIKDEVWRWRWKFY